MAPRSGVNAESIRGEGFLFLIVILFRLQKSTHGLREESFLVTKKNPAPSEKEDSLMLPLAKYSLMYVSLVRDSGFDRL